MDDGPAAPLARLQIEHRKLDELKLPERRIRTQNAKADAALAAVIRQTRVMLPLVIDADDVVRVGLKRLRVAHELALEEVPTVQVTHLSPEQLRLLTIADIRMVEMSVFDEEALSLELKELDALKLDFSIELSGFDGAELDLLHKQAAQNRRTGSVGDSHPIAGSSSPKLPRGLIEVKPVPARPILDVPGFAQGRFLGVIGRAAVGVSRASFQRAGGSRPSSRSS